MGGVVVRAWVGLRARWRVAALLTVLLALAFGVALASVAGSARGRDALDRFVAATNPSVVEAFVDPGIPLDDQREVMDDLAAAAGTAPFARLASTITALPGPSGLEDPRTDLIVAMAALDDAYLADGVPILVDGQLPLDAGEVAVNEAMAVRRDLDVGDPLQVAVFRAADLERVGNGELAAPAASPSLLVGAVIRQPTDLAKSPTAQPGTLFEADDARLFLEPSFWEDHGPDLASYGRGIVIAGSEGDAAPLAASLRAAAGDRAVVFEGRSEELARLEPVGKAIALESDAMRALGLVVAVVTLGLLGSAARRVIGEDREDRDVLVALGFEHRQLVGVRALRALVAGAAAAALGIGVAIALSSRFPVGLAEAAEVRPGIDVDLRVLLPGAALLAVALVAWVLLGGGRARAGVGAPVPVTGPLSGLPALPATGAQMALHALRGRDGAGLRGGIVTAIAGVVAVAAAGTLGASLTRLVDDPGLQGWAWDVVVGNFSRVESSAEGRAKLEQNPDVAGYAGFTSLTADLEGHETPLLALETGGDPVAPVVLEGRAPAAPDEIALGRGTLEQLDKEVGEEVGLATQGRATRLRIVGAVVAPAVLAPEMDLDSGGVVTTGGAAALYGGDPDVNVTTSYAVLLDAEGGSRRAAAVERLRADFPGTLLGPMAATDVGNLERIRGLPYVLAVLLGLLAVGSVVVVLAAVARRRRREVALIRVLGADRRQVRSLLGAQATTLAVLALLVGVPLGIALGRLLWRLTAGLVGSAIGPAVPLAGIALVCVVAFLVVNVVAQVPATATTRRRPGPALRVE